MATRNAATANTGKTNVNEEPAKVKLSAVDRQRISNLAAMGQTIKGVVAALKSGNIEDSDDMLEILAAQYQLVMQLGKVAARKSNPVSAPPAVSAD